MTRLTIDSNLLARLQQVTEAVEVCDQNGLTVGFFTPVVDRSLYAVVVPPITDEELDQREREGLGRPLAEILPELERRAS